MQVVILGYTGVLGKNILEHLFKKKKNLNFVCVGRKIESQNYKFSRVKYHHCDFSSSGKINLSFLDKANIVINCAGKTESENKNLEIINNLLVKKMLHYINTRKLKVRFIQLGSVSVYGEFKNYLGKKKFIKENSPIKTYNSYSKSKFNADKLIQSAIKSKINKNFSYTILRISNVYSNEAKSNLYKYLLMSLRLRFWIRSFEDVKFNFINIKDVSRSVAMIISKLKTTKNKIYIVSDDCNQSLIYNKFEQVNKKKIIKVKFSIKIAKFIIHNFRISRWLSNFILLVSSRVTYNNEKIKKEINFFPIFSLHKNINRI